MGNMLDRNEENNNEENNKEENNKEENNNEEVNKNEQKEYLETEEIPPDTQLNNQHKEVNENEANSENQNQVNQQDNQVQIIEQAQGAEKGEEIDQEGEEDAGEEERAEGGEEGEAEAEGEGAQQYQITQESLQNQMSQENQQITQNQILQEGQQNSQNQQYQFEHDGQLYINKNGQIFKVIQEVHEGQVQEGQEEQDGQQIQDMQVVEATQGGLDNQYNQITEVKYAEPIYQDLNLNKQFYLEQGMQIPNNQNLTQQYINYDYQISQENAEKSQRSNQVNQMQEENQIRESKRVKKTEPLDSNPKVHIKSNMSGKRSYNRNMERNVNSKFYNYEENNINKRILKSNQMKFNNYKNIDKLTLKEAQEFVDIPRKDYENYLDKNTVIINEGMDTGEYKFIGSKIIIKEGSPVEGIGIDEEEIINEIRRRNKESKEKKFLMRLLINITL